jgi:formylglycine-generating enzyme required for sulfatase activity
MSLPIPEITICEVPAGRYWIGDNTIGYSRPEHEVQIAAFGIGRTTVTNAQFAPFIAAGGYSTERYWGEMGWKWLQGKRETEPGFWRDPQFNGPDLPVVGVGWYEVDAYTRWLAEASEVAWRLPTEAEWEVAARGPDGEAPRPRQYNTVERGLGRPWAVTEGVSASWCGALDLCGNVWEWCSTRWGRSFQDRTYTYPYTKDDNREYLSGSYARVIRGGSWFDPLPEANPAGRTRYLPGSRASNIGFRLARSL